VRTRTAPLIGLEILRHQTAIGRCASFLRPTRRRDGDNDDEFCTLKLLHMNRRVMWGSLEGAVGEGVPFVSGVPYNTDRMWSRM